MPEPSNKIDDEVLKLSDTAMAHLYRGELGRSDRWRTRLDTTSNWALTVSAATVSVAFGSSGMSHVTVLVGLWLVITFLLIEARRYRYYDLWNRRVRLIEDGYWAPLLRREPIDPDALRELALELTRPQLQLSFFSALATRMNRAYGSLLMFMTLAWFAKVYSHPKPVQSAEDFFRRAHLGVVPGWAISALVAVLMIVLIAAFVISFVARAPLGELQARPRRRRLAVGDLFLRPYAVPPPRRRTPKPDRQTSH